MRAKIVFVVALLASACSGSAVIAERPSDASAEPLLEQAPTPAPASSEPVIFTDDLGDWYVPAPSVTDLVRPIDSGRTPDEILSDINAGVPSGYDLMFEWQRLAVDEDRTAQALVPVQWERRDDLLDFRSADLDFFTYYAIDSGCQGFCLPQQWELLMADPESSPFRILVDNGIEVMVDQPLTDPPGRLIVYDRSGVPNAGVAVTVEVVRWSNDADRFLVCDAGVGEPDLALWPALADACLAAVGDWLN